MYLFHLHPVENRVHRIDSKKYTAMHNSQPNIMAVSKFEKKILYELYRSGQSSFYLNLKSLRFAPKIIEGE